MLLEIICSTLTIVPLSVIYPFKRTQKLIVEADGIPVREAVSGNKRRYIIIFAWGIIVVCFVAVATIAALGNPNWIKGVTTFGLSIATVPPFTDLALWCAEKNE